MWSAHKTPRIKQTHRGALGFFEFEMKCGFMFAPGSVILRNELRTLVEIVLIVPVSSYLNSLFLLHSLSNNIKVTSSELRKGI